MKNRVPAGKKVVNVKMHESLSFNQFKPTHLAPQCFNTVANIDKMKQFIQKFVESDEVKKEIPAGVDNFNKWLTIFSL